MGTRRQNRTIYLIISMRQKIFLSCLLILSAIPFALSSTHNDTRADMTISPILGCVVVVLVAIFVIRFAYNRIRSVNQVFKKSLPLSLILLPILFQSINACEFISGLIILINYMPDFHLSLLIYSIANGIAVFFIHNLIRKKDAYLINWRSDSDKQVIRLTCNAVNISVLLSFASLIVIPIFSTAKNDLGNSVEIAVMAVTGCICLASLLGSVASSWIIEQKITQFSMRNSMHSNDQID